MRAVFVWVLLLLLWGCQKPDASFLPRPSSSDSSGFITYIIKAGAHYADANPYKNIETTALKFDVRFDSSAVYQSARAENQYDINKLYGFSDNNALHHQYSARFGWRWSDGALRLFGYVYNAGTVVSEELGTVPVGAVVHCSIRVTADSYLFYCNEQLKSLPRKSTTATGKGYLLYPYFGGDEAAPHEVRIRIKAL